MVYMITLKYSNYPNDNSLLKIFATIVIVFTPPLILIALPFLFNKSKKQLSQILQ
jgi:hypothetical protein